MRGQVPARGGNERTARSRAERSEPAPRGVCKGGRPAERGGWVSVRGSPGRGRMNTWHMTGDYMKTRERETGCRCLQSEQKVFTFKVFVFSCTVQTWA